VTGETVNAAARIEALNKRYNTTILASESTAKAGEHALSFRFIDEAEAPGHKEPLRLYEPLCRRMEMTDELERFLNLYNAGLDLWREGRSDAAYFKFQEALKLRPEDGPSRVWLRKCEEGSSVKGWHG
jgi:adenylate cyclase